MFNMTGNCKLTLKTFPESVQSIFKQVYNEGKFSDVTLICDDQLQFKAHRFVLSSCSPVFRQILAGCCKQAKEKFGVARSWIILYNIFSWLPEHRLYYIIFFGPARAQIILYNFFWGLHEPRLYYVIFFVTDRAQIILYNCFRDYPSSVLS